MAKKNDRKEYNKLKKKKADNKKQQEQCQSEIDVLDEKIERLKAAYRKLDDAKEAIDDIKHNQRNMINSDLYQCMWTGSNAQECYDSCESGNLYTAYDGYVSNIDAAEDAINWEINTLKEKMNEKYDTHIAQGGTNVSGGQKQRLAIARAIARNPEIYIFDDSFSALDYKTDSLLRKALKEYTKDATSLIVAQRIGTIMNADKIIVLEDGVSVGMGTHKELLKNCDVYKEIALSQLSEEELENAE